MNRNSIKHPVCCNAIFDPSRRGGKTTRGWTRGKTNGSFFKIPGSGIYLRYIAWREKRERERRRVCGQAYSPLVQMLSFDPPPVVFPRGAECKRLFSQSTGRAAARLGQKRWDLAEYGLSNRKQTLERKRKREKEKGSTSPPRSHNRLEFAYFSTQSNL